MECRCRRSLPCRYRQYLFRTQFRTHIVNTLSNTKIVSSSRAQPYAARSHNKRGRRRTIGLAIHNNGGPALRVGGALLHGSDGALPDVVRLGGETSGGGAEGAGGGQEAGSNEGGELHCCGYLGGFRDKIRSTMEGEHVMGTAEAKPKRARSKGWRKFNDEEPSEAMAMMVSYVTCLRTWSNPHDVSDLHVGVFNFWVDRVVPLSRVSRLVTCNPAFVMFAAARPEHIAEQRRVRARDGG